MSRVRRLLLFIPVFALLLCTACSPKNTASPAGSFPSSSASVSANPVASDTDSAVSPGDAPAVSESAPSSAATPAGFAISSVPAGAVPMSDSDLSWLTTQFDDGSNNGFVTQTYANASQVDIPWVLYSGAGCGFVPTGALYQALFPDEAPQTDYFCMKTADINAFLMKRLGGTLEEYPIDQNAGLYSVPQYNSEYDVYYYVHGDTSFEPITCLSGYTKADGTKVVNIIAYGSGYHTVAYQVIDGSFRYLSCVETPPDPAVAKALGTLSDTGLTDFPLGMTFDAFQKTMQEKGVRFVTGLTGGRDSESPVYDVNGFVCEFSFDSTGLISISIGDTGVPTDKGLQVGDSNAKAVSLYGNGDTSGNWRIVDNPAASTQYIFVKDNDSGLILFISLDKIQR